MKDPLRKHTSRAGLTVILLVNVKTAAKNIRYERKWKPVENKADGNAV